MVWLWEEDVTVHGDGWYVWVLWRLEEASE